MMGCRRKHAAGRSGFTLIELMLAITVLVVAMLAAVSSHVGSYNLLRTSNETNVAMADLRGAMEEILLQGNQGLPVAGSQFANGQPIGKFTALNLRGESVVATYPGFVPGAAVPNPLQIVVTITWNDYAGRPRALTLETMKAN